MASHHELGKKGEEIAAEHLRTTGYEVLHINWRAGRKEIDIVARKHTFIIFAEVKARSSSAFGWPEEAVDGHKQQLLEEAASLYLEKYKLQPEDIRFDIIAVNFDKAGKYELLHLTDVFS